MQRCRLGSAVGESSRLARTNEPFPSNIIENDHESSSDCAIGNLSVRPVSNAQTGYEDEVLEMGPLPPGGAGDRHTLCRGSR